MGTYSIKDLEKLSGIKAHTLRIWERRHGIIEPERTDTNIRFYSDDELRKILNISILNNHGFKISRIARMTDQEIEAAVLDMSGREKNYHFYIDQLTISMVELDEGKFNEVLHDLMDSIGLEDLMTQVLYPFLEKIGILWLTGNINPAQEHFISHLIRQKLIVAIDKLPNHLNPSLPPIMLFLPENELHELGLLFYYYLAKKIGFKVIYLGQSVPLQDALEVDRVHQPRALITSYVVIQQKERIKKYLRELSLKSHADKIFLAGSELSEEVFGLPKISRFDNALDLKGKLLEFAKSV